MFVFRLLVVELGLDFVVVILFYVPEVSSELHVTVNTSQITKIILLLLAVTFKIITKRTPLLQSVEMIIATYISSRDKLICVQCMR